MRKKLKTQTSHLFHVFKVGLPEVQGKILCCTRHSQEEQSSAPHPWPRVASRGVAWRPLFAFPQCTAPAGLRGTGMRRGMRPGARACGRAGGRCHHSAPLPPVLPLPPLPPQTAMSPPLLRWVRQYMPSSFSLHSCSKSRFP